MLSSFAEPTLVSCLEGRFERVRLPAIVLYAALIVSSLAAAANATTWGVKSRFDTGGSGTPAHLFRLEPGGSSLVDLGPVTLSGGQQIDVDALAVSQATGLSGFRWTASNGESQLVSIDTSTAVATPIGSALVGRELRGAVFVGSDLLAVDSQNDELLQVDPSSGSIIGSPIALTLDGDAYDVSNGVDLALHSSGALYLVSATKFFLLDPTTGVLTELFDDLVNMTSCPVPITNFIVGATFSDLEPSGRLIAFEAQCEEDILFYEVDDGFDSSLQVTDFIPTFNAGRGDLAALVTLPAVAVPVSRVGARLVLLLAIIAAAVLSLGRPHFWLGR